MNDEQVLHAMCIDDLYRVDRTLAQGPGGTTELVSADGSGPFVRKKIPTRLVRRRIWSMLADCDCPRLPHVVATYELPDAFVVVYDYVPGETLESLVAARGKLGQDQAVRLTCQVCEALGALHELDIVHRDVTPANVIVAADGAHLVDLGIARIRNSSATKDTTSLGTYGFASPEQFGFAQTDARSDVFSVGRLLGYMLTGVRPDEDDGRKYEKALADAAVEWPALREVIKRACAFEPSARYQSVEGLVGALQMSAGAPAGQKPGVAAGLADVRDGRRAGHVGEGARDDADSEDGTLSRRRHLRAGIVVGLAGFVALAVAVCLLRWGPVGMGLLQSGESEGMDRAAERVDGGGSSEASGTVDVADGAVGEQADAASALSDEQVAGRDDMRMGTTASGEEVAADGAASDENDRQDGQVSESLSEADSAEGAPSTGASSATGTATMRSGAGTDATTAAQADDDAGSSMPAARAVAGSVAAQGVSSDGPGGSAQATAGSSSSKGTDAAATVVDDATVDGLKLGEAGWSFSDGYVHFVYEVRNSSESDVAQYPSVSVVGRAQDGSILFSTEDTMFSIYPGASEWRAGLAACTGAPARVEFKVVGAQAGLPQSFSQVPVYTVGNVSVMQGDGKVRVTGEVACEQADDLSVSDQLWVTVVGRDGSGDICEGETEALIAPKSGRLAAFDVSVYTRRTDLTYEVYAGQR